MADVLGCGRKEPRKRQAADFYPTADIEAAEALIGAERVRLASLGRVWEPCAGAGHMSAVLVAHGFDVAVSDVAERGLNLSHEHRRSVFDFAEPLGDGIFTNPPFGSRFPEKLVEHAFRLGISYVALLLPSGFYNADERARFDNRHQVSRVYPLAWRPDWTGEGRPSQTFTWFVWDKEATEQKFRTLRRPSKIDHHQPLVDIMEAGKAK